jgi:hypothetical protein
MKRGIILVLSILIVSLIFVTPLILADENDTEEFKVDKAYDCLEGKVKDRCSSLSLEERIFSLLAIQKCKDEVVSDSKYESDVKLTAQAILALNEAGTSTTEAETWLLSQNQTPPDIIWYLQIESPSSTICSITYGGSEYSVAIGEDKKISSGAGSCLSLSEGGWWLTISQSCYDNEFEISCDKQFLTSLLFKKETSSTIHVSEKTNSASAEGTTIEKVNSFCFMQGGSCDYEGSLWAALVLDYLDYDISSYMPYLVTMTGGNEKYLPESFLYLLTDDSNYRIDLLEKQKTNYWDESGDKFYDTAVALYSFQYEEPQEKTSTKEWLLEVQDKSGCWKGNIRNTAFLLYSIWPKDSGVEPIPEEEDCEIDGHGYCMSSMSCQESGGIELSSYSSSCSGVNICCDMEKLLDTCEEMGGEVCGFSEECSTSTIEALDTSECCLGYCEEPVQESECELNGGACKNECSEDEEELSYSCDYGDLCCVEKTTPEASYWWIWVLLILIVLVLLGIIFRDKLRTYWFRIRSKFGKSRPRRGPRPGFPTPPRMFPRRIMPRRILPPTQKAPARKPRPKGELDDVLKKLKEMGK